nr:hypothetical protein HmN_000177900 [Hymenolepis microstoma]
MTHNKKHFLCLHFHRLTQRHFQLSDCLKTETSDVEQRGPIH